jgi:uncharacterized membrane protein
MKPLHPIFVHYPIALYVLELVLLLYWASKRDDKYREFARFSFRFAYLVMFVTMLTGLIDAGGIAGLTGDVLKHFYGALIIFVIATLRAIYWRKEKIESPSYRFILIAGSVLLNLAVVVTAFLGGKLVYE